MTHCTNIRKRAAIIALLGLLTMAMLAPSSASAEGVNISPPRIILNAQGQFDCIQAVIRMSMASGYVLSDYHVTLSFNGTTVAEACQLRYCYVDDNFLACFERTPILAHPAVIEMAGGIVGATVEGWYEAVNGDGESYTRSFSFTDMVEILDPDKK